MKKILFTDLKKRPIDKVLIDAVTLDIFGLQVIIDHDIYQVINADQSIYYKDCLKAMHDDLAVFEIKRIFFHESLSFHPSLGLNDKPDQDIWLNQDFIPGSQQRIH
jgi:hypothetical protein